MLVFENVAGLLTANRGDALARVVHGLAALGYLGSWRTVRASDVGAPHRRARWFCIAAHAAGSGRWPTGQQRRLGLAEHGQRDVPDAGRSGWQGIRLAEPDGWPLAPGDVVADPAGDGWDERRAEPTGLIRGPDAAVGGDGAASHTQCIGLARSLQQGLGTVRRTPVAGDSPTDWGIYGPAVTWWERTVGRPAPAPTQPGRTGQPRLSPTFTEWLMGLPAGHVTDVPGVRRNAQLRILGNGCVPQQAAYAVAQLLDHLRAAA